MRILLVHNDHARFSGEEHAIDTVAELLDRRGHEVRWFRRSSAAIAESLGAKAGAFFSGIHSRGAQAAMDSFLTHEQMDLVFVQNLFPLISPAVLPVCRAHGVPVVMRCPNYRLFCPTGLHLSRGQVCERCVGGREWNCILRNCMDDRFKSLGYAARTAFARLRGTILSNVTTFIVLSEFQRRKYVDAGIEADRIEVLPNPMPRVALGSVERPGDYVAFVGRLAPEKGSHEFVDAARRLPALPFEVAGQPHEAALNAGRKVANIAFRGFLTGGELESFIARSRIVVLPSKWYEGFPTVLVAAMAWGKPVIASRIGALPEIVEEGVTGLLVESGSVSDLVAKIEQLWQQPELCLAMGAAARKRARRHYGEEPVASKLVDICERAVRRGCLGNRPTFPS